jgi:hypothetical protein
MIFRCKQNGTLLNVRRDDFTNDRLYFQEIIRVEGSLGGIKYRYSSPFEEVRE